MAQSFVKALPGGNGWSAGGYNFVVDDDGSFKYGKPDDSLSSVSTSDFSQIVSTSKPTQRTDGNALVIGDRWWKSDDGTSWYWNGTYWLSRQLYRLRAWTGSGGLSATLISQMDSPVVAGSVFFEKNIISSALMNTPQNSSNYWRYFWNIYTSASSQPTLQGLTTSDAIPGGTTANQIFSVNINTAFSDFQFADGAFERVGSPGNLRRTSMLLTYRIIA